MNADCYCVRHPHRSLQGDHPDRNPELLVESHTSGHAPEWRLRCSHCGTNWRVIGIPGGGIYGDFDWERLD